MNDYEVSAESVHAHLRENWWFRFWEIVLWPQYQVERLWLRFAIWRRRRREAAALQADFETWDRLSDEAFVDFERSLTNCEQQESAGGGETNEGHVESARVGV